MLSSHQGDTVEHPSQQNQGQADRKQGELWGRGGAMAPLPQRQCNSNDNAQLLFSLLDKILDKSKLRKEERKEVKNRKMKGRREEREGGKGRGGIGSCFGLQFNGSVHHSRRAMVSVSQDGWSHCIIHCQKAERDERWYSAHFLLFLFSEACRIELLTFRMSLGISINSNGNYLPDTPKHLSLR